MSKVTQCQLTVNRATEAAAWGAQDGSEGKRRDSSVFLVNSVEYNSYHQAYNAAVRNMITGYPLTSAASAECAWFDEITGGFGVCPVCGIYIDKHGRCNCNSHTVECVNWNSGSASSPTDELRFNIEAQYDYETRWLA